jgi:hypothetical protein
MHRNDSDRARFEELRNDPFDYWTDAEWDAYYERMAPYMESADASMRRSALERLCMAAMRAEPSSFWRREPRGRVPREHAVKRLNWLTGLVSQARLKFPETGPAFLEHLRYHGDDEPFCGPLREWLHGWLKNPPDGVSTDKIRGTLVLLGDCGASWEEAAPRWLELLDDPSDYVRACAAKMLGEHCGPETAPSTADLFELIAAKEIVRPGIAGPFWRGPWCGDSDGPDPLPWMMGILEKRQGDEPDDLPFNGIDFHLHEFCGGDIRAIERMIELGHKALALEAATELRRVVDGMKEILLRLGEDPDTAFAQPTWYHLALYYRTLHPCAEGSGLVRAFPDWHPRSEAFGLWRAGEADPFAVVLYPNGETSAFQDAEAWQLIDRVLPEDLRGAVGKSILDPHGEPGPYRLSSAMLYNFTSGAMLTLEGEPEKRLWSRIEILRRSLQGRWHPEFIDPG